MGSNVLMSLAECEEIKYTFPGLGLYPAGPGAQESS